MEDSELEESKAGLSAVPDRSRRDGGGVGVEVGVDCGTWFGVLESSGSVSVSGSGVGVDVSAEVLDGVLGSGSESNSREAKRCSTDPIISSSSLSPPRASSVEPPVTSCSRGTSCPEASTDSSPPSNPPH